MKITKNTNCRICNSENLEKFLDLGEVGLVSNFIKKEDIKKNELIPKLNVYICKNCWLAQIIDILNPEELFLKDYPYYTGYIATMIDHFDGHAQDIATKFNLDQNSLVVDIGGNDGVFLNGFKKLDKNINLLCVDPAPDIVNHTRKKDIDVFNNFFGEKNADVIKEKYGAADVILSTNTFAHIDNIHDFMKGVKKLLKKDGVFIFENPYIVDILEKLQFDTMYYDHVSNFGIHPLNILFSQFDMTICDVKRTEVHGGSILVSVKNNTNLKKFTSMPEELVELEKSMRLNTIAPYTNFSSKVKKLRSEIINGLRRIKGSKKRIVGYGASARGNTTLCYCNIDTTIIDYIADKNELKQNRYTPLTHIPILNPEKILEDMPDYVLIIAWNFADEIILQLDEYKKRGGKFIIPIPEFKIV